MLQQFLAGVLPILLIISVIVTFHEYGHYSVARLFKTRIDRFSLGFGPILLKVTDKRGVDWCLSALPLGGYVKFAGDENIASMAPSAEDLEAARQSITAREGAAAVNDYFHFKPIWQRFLIILAGPMFNFILAIVLFAGLGLAYGDSSYAPEIGRVMPNSPAATAGFQPGDRIVRVDDQPIQSFQDVSRVVMLHANTRLTFVVERKGQPVTVSVTPIRAVVTSPDGMQKTKAGYMGIAPTGKLTTRPVSVVEAIPYGAQETWKTLSSTLTYISRIFVGRENGDQITSILGMTKVTGDYTVKVSQAKAPLADKAEFLLQIYIGLAAAISVGVGFLNLLPIPILDGGHLAFYVYQGVTKKHVSAGFQSVAFRLAAVLILGLMLFAFWNDINNHFGLGR